MYSALSNDLFNSVFSDFDDLMNSSRLSFKETFPPMNIFYDKENKCSVIQMATAGYSKDELSVSVDGKKLTVKGTPKEEDSKESVSYVRNKIHKSVFERVYSLPDGYDFDSTSVTYKDGLLTITIPLMEKKNSSKSIEIL